MKKSLLMTVMLVLGLTFAVAQNQAEIRFDKVTYDFGTFSGDSPVYKIAFTFTNVGKASLVINQIVASCGCTIPSYDKKSIAPGQRGTIDMMYNGTGRFPGYFKKNITVCINGKVEMTQLYIEGVMTGKQTTN